ncbi:hypothetical protein PMIN03_013060 [Paraphaeosphaeria minitans]
MLPCRTIMRLTVPWLLAAGYMLLSGLYTRDPRLRLDNALLCFFAILSCALGHFFVICLLIDDTGLDSQEDLVLVPALHATLFGLFSIPCNLLASRDYVWGPASAAGIVVGAVSASTFGALLMWKQASKSRSKGAVASLQNHGSPLLAVSTPKSDIEHQMSALLLSPEPPEADSSFRIDMPPVPEVQKRLEGRRSGSM